MAELKSSSPDEISLHATKQDCWLSIGGKVYDVTAFLEEHPGGEDVILHASASGDATQAFEEVGHSSAAISLMKSYLIGTVEGYNSGDQKPSKPATTVEGYNSGDQKPSKPATTVEGYNSGDQKPSKPVTTAYREQAPSYSFSDYLLPLLVLAVASAAWYYVTFYSKTKA